MAHSRRARPLPERSGLHLLRRSRAAERSVLVWRDPDLVGAYDLLERELWNHLRHNKRKRNELTICFV